MAFTPWTAGDRSRAMRIESIDIRGFGRLRDRRIDFSDGRAALIIEDNEVGKTTLAAAILAALCGFPSRRREGELMKLSDVYKPWDGGPYAVEMDLEAGGRRWHVERDFACGSFTVRDPDTNRDVSAEFETDLAFHFLRLGRDDLKRIAFISGKEVSVFQSSASLRERLAAMVEGSSTDAGAETAIAALLSAGYALDGRQIKVDTAVSRLTKAVADTTRKMAELDASIAAAEEDVRELEQVQARQSELSARLTELDSHYASARLREVREQISAAESDEGRVRALREEMASLEPYASFPVERRDQLTRAATRAGERQAEMRSLEERSRALSAREDALRTRVDELPGFATATDSDLVALTSAEETLRAARRELESAEADRAAEKRSSGRVLGRALAASGILLGLVSAALMVLQVMSILPSALGVVVGVLIAAAGLVRIAAAGTRGARSAARLDQAERLISDAHDRALRLLGPLGVQCVDGADIVSLLLRTRQALERHLRDRDELRSVRQEIARLSRDMERCREASREERDVVESILSDAGIAPSATIDDALREFEALERKHRRWAEIRGSLLPALEARLLSAETLRRLRSEEAALAAGQPETPEDPQGTPAQIDAERQAVRVESEELAERARQIDRRVGLTVETYRRDYPALREELASLRSELARAERFGRAVALAAGELGEVARATRRRWAAALNERVGEILPHLNPDYEGVLFDDSLDFTVRHVPDGRIIERAEVDARLSTGAKDQLYLAVRLACCAELSGLDEPLPVILDDPLIAFDDSRFESALRYLVETLAGHQQVILLSCHRSRHLGFADRDWFRASVSLADLAPESREKPAF